MQITIPFNFAALFDETNVEHLPYREKAQELFELIKDCEKKKGWAFFKLTWLAKRLAITKRYVQKLIQVLRNAALIEVKRREQNFYRVNPLLEQTERKSNKTTPATKPSRPTNERELRDKATTEIGASAPASQPMVNEAEARAIIEAFEASKLEDSSVSINEEVASTEEAIEGDITEMTEVTQEAAKEVWKESRYYRPKSLPDYFDRVKARLAQWQIEVPGRLLTDIVVQFWRTW